METEGVTKVSKYPFRRVLNWFINAVIAALVAALIFNVIMRSAVVHGDSMHPTLLNGDRVYVNRFAYAILKPERGDVIAFPYTLDPSRHFVKRVIGLPGDVIDCVGDALYINGEPYADEFADNGFAHTVGNWDYPIVVPEGSYFVMGDNRDASQDSRSVDVGCIPLDDIDGRLFMRFSPAFGLIR